MSALRAWLFVGVAVVCMLACSVASAAGTVAKIVGEGTEVGCAQNSATNMQFDSTAFGACSKYAQWFAGVNNGFASPSGNCKRWDEYALHDDLDGTFSLHRTYYYVQVNAGGSSCPGGQTTGFYSNLYFYVYNRSCPANSTTVNDSTTSCTCNEGYNANAAGTACESGCPAGGSTSSGYYDIGTGSSARPPLLACSGGCESVFDGTSPAGSALVDGVKHYFAEGEYVATGNQCSSEDPAAPTSSSEPPPDTCGPGQYAGTVNNTFTCVDGTTGEETGSSPGDPVEQKTTETTTETHPDGSTTKTETETTKWSDGDASGTQTRTKTTTCDASGENCTSEEITEGEGPPSVDDGEEDDPADPCEDNPGLVSCTELGTPPVEESLFDIELPVFITPEEGFEHSMECPADKVLSLHFVTVRVPFTMICDAADMARPIVIAVAWLSATLGFLGLARRD